MYLLYIHTSLADLYLYEYAWWRKWVARTKSLLSKKSTDFPTKLLWYVCITFNFLSCSFFQLSFVFSLHSLCHTENTNKVTLLTVLFVLRRVVYFIFLIKSIIFINIISLWLWPVLLSLEQCFRNGSNIT